MAATTAAPPAGAGQEPAAQRKGLLLAVCCAAQFLVILDLSIVNIALPSIQTALLFSAADLQWVIDAYAIVFAGFLMLAGRAADVLGHRKLFVGSLVVFGIASLIGGLAGSSGLLTFARGLQGFAGAGMAAASLAIITSSFAAGPERARAIGLWGAMNGLGGAVGMLAGGILTDVLSWRWVLLVNVPVAAVAAVLAWRVVADRRRGERQGFDLVGALLLTSGLLIATYGGVNAGSHGWTSGDALIPMAIGSLLILAFQVYEAKVARDPLLPAKAITPALRNINIIVLLFSAALFPMWYVGSLYMQQVLALSPLETGLTFLPMALVIFACASQAGKLVARAGVKPVLGGGLVLLTAGLVLFAQIEPGGSPWQYVILPGVLTAMGIGFSIVPSTVAATQSAGVSDAGLTSGLVNSARQIGGGLGLAILISIATQHQSALIGEGEPVTESLTEGFRIAYYVGAGLAGAAALLTFLLLPGARERSPVARRVAVATGVTLAAFAAVGFGAPRTEDQPIGHFTMEGAHRFVSAPGLHPPQMQVVTPVQRGHGLPGLIMAANFYDLTKAPMVGQSGPLILDDQLQPVWFRPVPEDLVAGNLQVAELDGEPVLAWWQGEINETGEVSSGEVVVVDTSYREVARIEGVDDWIITLHELLIRDGVAWVTSAKNVKEDLSDVGGVSSGVLVDSGVQRYDVKTGKLLSTWKASDHIAMGESETQPPPNGFPWDAYHINSIDLTPDGKMLLSMRNTSAGYLVDVESGEIEWRLGGTRSDFDLPREARFEWQHDLRLRPDGTVTLFDNHCCEITGAGDYLPAKAPSRGLVLRLDEQARTASVVRELSHGATFNAQYMGNAQFLEGGDTWVGWGQVPYMSLYDEDDELVFDGAFPTPNMSYRSYVQRWTGKPAGPPRCAVQDGAVHASYNGATELAQWRVVRDGERIAQRPKDGFETRLPVRGATTGLTVEALDAGGRVLGSCKTATRRG